MDDYPTFAVVEYHMFDPPYQTTWGTARGLDFYPNLLGGVPLFAYDGLFNLGSQDDRYEAELQQRLAVTTDVTLAVSGVETAANSYEITTDVCIETGGFGKTMRIYVVQLLDHYPPTELYYRNSFMQAAATEDVTLAAGDCTQVVRNFTFDAASMAQVEDIKIVAWAQEPLAVYPAEVHQSIESPWPFIDLTIFDDGFEAGDTTAWSAVNP